MKTKQSEKLGIWIDLKRAIMIRLSGRDIKVNTLYSGIEPHERIKGENSRKVRQHMASFDYEGRQQRHLLHEKHAYMKSVLQNMGSPDAVVLLGPAQTKKELEKELVREKPSIRIAGVEACDQITDNQLIAMVKKKLNRY